MSLCASPCSEINSSRDFNCFSKSSSYTSRPQHNTTSAIADCFVLYADSRPRKSCNISPRFPTSPRIVSSVSFYASDPLPNPPTISGYTLSFIVPML